MRDSLEPRRDVLVGFPQQLDEFLDDVLVASVEERGTDSDVTSTTRATNTMNIVVDVAGQVVVDDVSDVGDIQATSGDSSSNHDRSLSSPEGMQGVLTLPLGAVTVDGGGRHVVAVEEVAEHVGHTLGLDENEGEAELVSRLTGQDIEKDAALVVVLNVFDLLGDVLAGGADTTNAEENVILQEITGKHLDVAREGGAEHEGLPVLNAGHIFTLDNSTNLRFETHVQHAISLIEDEILDVGKADAAALNEIDEATRGGGEEVTALLDEAELLIDIGSTIHDSRADPRSIRKFASLLVNLRNEFTGRGEDEGGRVGLARAAIRLLSALRDGRRTIGKRGRQDGEEETARLSGTSL